MQYIHVVEYCQAINRNEMLRYTASWMNLENVMLSERHQSQKTVVLLYDSIFKEISRIDKAIKTENGFSSCFHLGKGEGVGRNGE